MQPNFIHLQMHSEYSIRDGLIRLNDLAKICVRDRIPAIALTDHMNLFALVKFYKAFIKLGIKPIFGADIFIYKRPIIDKHFRYFR